MSEVRKGLRLCRHSSSASHSLAVLLCGRPQDFYHEAVLVVVNRRLASGRRRSGRDI